MSTYTYFYLPEKEIEKLNEEIKKDNNSYILGLTIPDDMGLLMTVLKQPDNFECPNYERAFFNIKLRLNKIVDKTRKEIRKQILEEINECESENKYFCFNGIYDSDNRWYCDTDEFIIMTAKDLLIYNTILKVPDYFSERDNFDEFKNDIEAIIKEFEESSYDVIRWEFADKYKEFMKVNY